jgi:dihydrofolate synthase/folylpolyglutamate synthase
MDRIIMQTMAYQDALDYLYSFLDTEQKLPHKSIAFNLPRTVALLAALDEPQRAFRSVLIAGTKGKGSTAAFLEAILRQSGLRVALWTSPHLHSYRERIQIDREMISQAALIRAVAAIQPVVAAFDQLRYGAPTVFELGFAIALRYFAEQAVDLAVLEIGLGGRYDCANVVTPLLAIISSISYDHMQLLGEHLAQIAYEKAGIIKPGVPTITIPQHPDALHEIARVAAQVGAPLWIAADRTAHAETRSILAGDVCDATLFDPFERYHGPSATALQGVFQRENARLATGAALLLRDGGLAITDAAIAAGLATARWPGRLEIVGDKPPIILDGAHNGDSARKLIQSLAETFPNRRLVLVLGTSHDKDIRRIVAELIPHAGALILTHSRHPRALIDLAELAATTAPLLRRDMHVPVVLTPDVPEALDQARALAGPDDVICVTGSLFVVAAAREALGLALEKD